MPNQSSLPYHKRHAFEAVQLRPDGTETRLAIFTVTRKYPLTTARRMAQNRCLAARAADPGFAVEVREINAPRPSLRNYAQPVGFPSAARHG